jgi:hypothetical protein
MRSLRALLLRVGGLFRKDQHDADLSSELESHLRMHIEENLRAGMSPEEARRQALIKLGGVEQTKEMVRERRGLPYLKYCCGICVWRAHAGEECRFHSDRGFSRWLWALARQRNLQRRVWRSSAPASLPKPDQIFQLWEVSAKGHRMNFTEPNFSTCGALPEASKASPNAMRAFTIPGG